MSATSGHLDHLAELVEAQDAFWATISDVDPATAVPWCGDWRVSDLVEHLARVHLWDLRTAGGLGLDARPEVWADTVDEVVTVMQPRQVSAGRMPRLPSAIELAASDVDRTWRLDTADDGPAVVQVRAPASVLALMLWGRSAPDDAEVEVSGDGDVLSAALAEPITP